MHGWRGQRLRIDMTNGSFEIEKLSREYCRKWIGGRGFNSDVVYHETAQGMDPFDPASPLCFASGPLCGSFAPLAGRTTVSARSPLTCSVSGLDVHGHGDTNMGGSFGPQMRFAGYDQIIVKGKADRPTWVVITDDHVEFRDAGRYWGKGVKKATNGMLEELDDPSYRIALIGPAGENLVRFACVANAFSSVGGRTGMGAVMGSKNLKAIAVKGTQPLTFEAPDLFIKLAWELREKIHASPSAIRRRIEGSMDLFDVGNAIGINAHRNVSTGFMPRLEEVYGGLQWAEQFLFRRKACWSCPVGCGRYTLIKEGRYEGFNCGGPEMESVCNLGPRIDTYDVAGVNVLCGLVNELGMDSISAGAALSWTMEAFEKGYLDTAKTGGVMLDWGDIDGSYKLLNQIARRETEFAHVLGEGNIRAAAHLGAGMDIVPHCRGLEHISVDPRVALGFSLGYAMSTRGSDHLKNYSCLEFPGCATSRAYQIGEVFTPEMETKFWENFPRQMVEIETKPQLCTWSEKNKCVADMVSCCCQAIGSWGRAGNWHEAYSPLLRAAADMELSDEEIFESAERVVNIERAHWLRDGSGKQDDTHIDRYFEEPVADGPHKGLVLDREQWAWAQQEYYRLHGWDGDGFISPAKSTELGIAEIIPDMESGKRRYLEFEERNKASR